MQKRAFFFLSLSQLQLFENLLPIYNEIEQRLQNGEMSIMLFKNITKRKDLKEKTFRTTQATFITNLNTEIEQDLRKLINRQNQVLTYTIICLFLITQLLFFDYTFTD